MRCSPVLWIGVPLAALLASLALRPASGEPRSDTDPKAFRKFMTKEYERLDRWRETVGVGPAAKTYLVLKVRHLASGEVKVYRLGPDGALAEKLQQEAAPKAQDKISLRLRRQFEEKQRGEAVKATLPVVVHLVGRNRPPINEAKGAAAEEGEEIGPKERPEKKPNEASLKRLAAATKALAQERARVQEENQKSIKAFLESAEVKQGQVVHRYSQAPAVVLNLTLAEASKLAERKDVRFLFPVEPTASELDVVVPSSLAPAIWESGWTGAGVTVAIIGEGGRIARENPNLNVAREDIRFPDSSADGHATGIAGIIASRHTTLRGIAPDCRLLSACREGAATSASVDAAADWALGRGAVILSCSQGWNQSAEGELHWSDIYFDHLVHNSRVLFVKSAGNRGASGDHGRVTSPGRGYNSLSVGNVDERGTQGWSDDVMAATSSYVNPATGTHKPETSAYGSSIRSTTTSDPWTGDIGSGTSYAAPLVAGIAALCVQRDPGLADEPQALKAMVMAGGLAHNVEGDALLSDRDGAGAVKATAARAAYHVRTMRDSDFDTNGLFELPVTIPLQAGVARRVVMVYSHPPTSESADPAADPYRRSDLDLELHVGGTRVAHSALGDRNPFEIIDLVPSASGSAKLKVRRTSWHGDVPALRVGFAWVSSATAGSSPGETDLPSPEMFLRTWKTLPPDARRDIWKRVIREAEAESKKKK